MDPAVSDDWAMEPETGGDQSWLNQPQLGDLGLNYYQPPIQLNMSSSFSERDLAAAVGQLIGGSNDDLRDSFESALLPPDQAQQRSGHFNPLRNSDGASQQELPVGVLPPIPIQQQEEQEEQHQMTPPPQPQPLPRMDPIGGESSPMSPCIPNRPLSA